MNAMTGCRNAVQSYPVTVIRVPPACGPNTGRTSMSIGPIRISQRSIRAIIHSTERVVVHCEPTNSAKNIFAITVSHLK